MILIRLFFEFFRVGLFSVGGGLATIPFLNDLGSRTGWFTSGDLADMIAVSESTPGAMGINMATYVGFTCGGPFGGVIATLGVIAPSIIIILVISRFLQRFRKSKLVDSIFYGLRAASVALITSAMFQVARVALISTTDSRWASGAGHLYWPAIALTCAIFILIKFTPLKKIHPLCFIAMSAIVGIVFQL